MSFANIRPANCCGNCENMEAMETSNLICMEHEDNTEGELVCDLFKMRPISDCDCMWKVHEEVVEDET